MNRVVKAQGAVFGVFEKRSDAEEAVQALKIDGFDETRIGVAAPFEDDSAGVFDGSSNAAAAGAAVGLGTGALWGLGIVAGVLPGIGPAIAGGTLAAILSSAAVGAGAAGLGGAFIGLGFGSDDAEYAQSELKEGKTIVTVNAGERADAACAVLERFRWIEAGAPPIEIT